MHPQESNDKNNKQIPGTGQINFGDLRRLEPLTRSFGYDRGQPIDRYYIEKFLKRYSDDITGDVVEIGDDRYTKQFGKGKVAHSDVLDQKHPGSSPTIVADLTNAAHVPSNSFDCAIVIQTLQFIYNIQDAISTLHRMLKQNGVLLVSIPAVSPISRYDMDRWGDYWRFTSAAVQKLFQSIFEGGQVEVEAYGNVLVATAFLYGMAAEDLTIEELEFRDRDYEALICVRAVKK